MRCDTDGRFVPPTMHLFLPRTKTGAWDTPRLKRTCRTNDPRQYAGFVLDPAQHSSVLHYAIWEPHALWAKYHMHGAFPDAIAGAALKGGMVWGEMFHTFCRDFYLQRRGEPDGGRSAMHGLFRRAAALEDGAEVERQMRAGVLCRVGAVREMLLGATPPHAESPHALAISRMTMRGAGVSSSGEGAAGAAGAGASAGPMSEGGGAESESAAEEDDELRLEENGDGGEQAEDGPLLESNEDGKGGETGGLSVLEDNAESDGDEPEGPLLEDNELTVHPPRAPVRR